MQWTESAHIFLNPSHGYFDLSYLFIPLSATDSPKNLYDNFLKYVHEIMGSANNNYE